MKNKYSIDWMFDADQQTSFRRNTTIEDAQRIASQEEQEEKFSIWQALIDSHDCHRGPESGCHCDKLWAQRGTNQTYSPNFSQLDELEKAGQ